MTDNTTCTNDVPKRIVFEYDYQGRRIAKKVWNNVAGTNDPIVNLKYLYDGWNLIAELDGNNALVRSYTWGLDASGSMQGAGGVGGLLMVNAGSGGVHFPAYDLNGNVMGLVNATNGIISAKYEYGPFGEVFCSVGDMAKVNPFQFSTKYTDTETDFVYYGYRYYSPALGRWLSRDPIEEQGGLNLYGFVNNDPVNGVDVLGLYEYEWEGNFTSDEKRAIKDSIQRVRNRAQVLIGQMDDNIKKLKKCPCPAYDEIANHLENIKKVLQGMVKDIDDPGFNLEIYKKNMPGKDAEYWGKDYIFWCDHELRLNPKWFRMSPSDQDTIMFHEITHGQGTDDGESGNGWNNAGFLEALMHLDKEVWPQFRNNKRFADKKCKK
jgi:RHS repeat-associated protein